VSANPLPVDIVRQPSKPCAVGHSAPDRHTTTPHGELLFSLFGALAQYERALTRERVMAGLAAAKRRGRQGGRPPMIDAETLERITAALDGGASKASVCRTFKVPRSTLLGTLARIGWTAPAKA
jgi:DNA invertase Pin-like site-specific DNA recombinase